MAWLVLLLLCISQSRISALHRATVMPIRLGSKLVHSVWQGDDLDPVLTRNDALVNAISEVEEPACLDMLQRIRTKLLTIPLSTGNSASIESTYVHLPATHGSENKKEPLILLHGFDSSLLEYRRLAPLLAAAGYDVFVVDILGWGFAGAPTVATIGSGSAMGRWEKQQLQDACYTPEAKLQQLWAFVDSVLAETGCSEVSLVGASLGGGIAVCMAAEVEECRRKRVRKLVLLDPQATIDGSGPSPLPRAIARIGAGVLRSRPLRQLANRLSYFDVATFASADALKVGALHCNVESWLDAAVGFLLSGGFIISDKLSSVQQATLVLWGERDRVLDRAANVPLLEEKLVRVLCGPDGRRTGAVTFVPRSGHVPHLERPQETANLMCSFLAARDAAE